MNSGPAGRPSHLTSAADYVTSELRDMILHGAIRPGERINIKGLEERFQLSHIPIREGLRKLETEGWIDMMPQRGAVVAEISIQELDDIYDLRSIIEPKVAHRAVLNAVDADRAGVVEATERLELAENETDPEQFLLAHAALHWSMLAPGSTAEIERVLQHLSRVAGRYIRLTRYRAGEEAHEQHVQMVDAFMQGEAEVLEGLVYRHLRLTADAFRVMLADPGTRSIWEMNA